MKYLKTYQLFESRTGLTKGQENFLNEYTEGTWTYNPATGLVDVEGDFGFNGTKRKSLSGVRFGKVSGYFRCHYNKLTSLEGAPQEVGGNFNCAENKLTSLAGAPQEVGGDFVCRYNKLTSLKGAPQEVEGEFNCRNNKLTSLEGAPQEVGKDFVCDAFRLEEEVKWSFKGWLKVLAEGRPEAQKLISTILSAEELNKEIARDPAGMIMKLKEFWNDENFKDIRSKLVWPKGYGDSADLVGDLDDIGF